MRNAHGTIAVLVLMLSVLGVLVLGLFSFEVGRLNYAQQQLQNAVDAAALTAAATLASEDNSDPTAAHNTAIATALNMFEQNAIMGVQLTNTTIASIPNNTPAANNATLYFEFSDPITKTVQPLSSPTGKVVSVEGDFGLNPAFLAFLGPGQIAVHATSHSVVPPLDIVLCFDVSGSMDDQTPVTFIKRKWDSALGKVTYLAPSGALYGTHGKIYDVLQPGAVGSSFNGTPPEYLCMGRFNAILEFSEMIAALSHTSGLRTGGVYPEAGRPPGNYPPGTAPAWDGTPVFTDVVVNLDNNTTFAGISSGGYSFPNVPTLVEAARGNLESAPVFNSSKANTALSVAPAIGYQAKYFQLANQLLQPITDAKNACLTFTNIINTDTDAHFGFVAFDEGIGASANDTKTVCDIDQDQFTGVPNYGAPVAYPRPLVPLDSTPGNSGYSTVNTAINSCVPMGGTNIAAAVQAAVTELTTHQRRGTMRAIVLITDGQPNVGLNDGKPAPPGSPDPWLSARNAAVAASNAGIPVFTIGLAQDPAVAAGETAILNDTDPSPSNGGIAAISGHGATFNLVNQSSQLVTTFEKLARRLVQLQGTI